MAEQPQDPQLIVKGAESQTANLQQWQNSGPAMKDATGVDLKWQRRHRAEHWLRQFQVFLWCVGLLYEVFALVAVYLDHEYGNAVPFAFVGLAFIVASQRRPQQW